jgi:hypothetical protein
VLDDRTRRPLSGAIVRAESGWPLDSVDAPSVTSDESGRFELRAVTASRRILGDDRSLIELYLVSVEINDFTLVGQRALVWKHPAGAPLPAVVDNIELLLVPTGSLIVKLHWPDGRDVGVWNSLRVFDSDGNGFESNMSAGEECGLNKVPAGELHVVAMAQGPRGLARADVSLRAGEVKTIDLMLQSPDAAIEGDVVDAQGRGVPGVSLNVLSLVEQGGRLRAMDPFGPRTDAQGHFRLEEIYAGACKILSLSEDGPTTMSFWPPMRTIELKEGSLVSGLDFRAEPSVILSGSLAPMTALDSSRFVVVELTHAEFGSLSSKLVNEDGRFEFPAMRGASYVLIARQGSRELGRLAVPQAGNRELIVPIGP